MSKCALKELDERHRYLLKASDGMLTGPSNRGCG
jgi:hypothetical protein